MSKYIRTKDGRIMDCSKYNPPIWWEDVLKKADTIEELCDEFVLETTLDDKLFRTLFRENKSARISKYDMFKESWKIFNGYPQEIKDQKLHNYYGAIWTDKGLIYVAKMNEKGELELL